jgi:hypothetical protein
MGALVNRKLKPVHYFVKLSNVFNVYCDRNIPKIWITLIVINGSQIPNECEIRVTLVVGTPSGPGLPDFSRWDIPKRVKIYQITTKCTKLL